jgi:predicted CxxxxCH...CXXCH cytochrome family protein
MRRRRPLLLGAAFAALAVIGCDEGSIGPRGSAGPDGPQGPQGPEGPSGNVCADCHGDNAVIVAIQAQVGFSPHGIGQYELRGPDYAGGACVACHSHQGFVAAAMGTEPDWGAGPAPMTCRTCHRIHTDEGWALTATDPITLRITGQTVDVSGADAPGGNLCASCHQGRSQSAWPDWLAPPTQLFAITSSHYGVHHGTQANVYTSELDPLFEFGVSTAGSFGPHDAVGCSGCHMGLGVDGFTPAPSTPDGELGHTWEAATDVCATCHDADFNYKGIQDEVASALDRLGACLEAEGVIELPAGEAASAIAADHGGYDAPEYHPVVGDHPEPYVAAYLVFNALVEDGSFGVHQPEYARALADAALQYMIGTSPACPVAE